MKSEKTNSDKQLNDELEIILVRHFYQETEAQLYVVKLREAGIESFLSNTNMNNVLMADFSSIGLHLRKEDFPKAKPILEGLDLQIASDNPDFSFEEASEVDLELERGLMQKSRRKSDQTFYAIAILLLMVAAVLAIINYLQQ